MIQLTNYSTNKKISGSPLVGVFFCHEINQPNKQKERSIEAVAINGNKSIAEILQEMPAKFNKQSIYIGSCLESDRLQLKSDRKKLLRTHQYQPHQSMVNHLQRTIAKTTDDIQQLLVQASIFHSSN
ncbi:MAG: hypothetical protein WC004_00750 [Candidatus Absconditabacterales bacterium]